MSPTGVQYGSYVIPVQSTPQGTKTQHFKPSSSLMACGFKRNSSLKNNCSTFAEGFAGGFCVPLKPNSQISGAASRSSREGISGSDFGQIALAVPAEGDTRPSEKPLLTLTITEEQLRDLAFAVYCQICGIQDGDEADHPEVVPVIRRLNEVSAMCIELEKRGLS